MNKKKIALSVVVAVFAAAVVGISIWQIVVDVTSRKVGLVSVGKITYEEPLAVTPEEKDVVLEDITMHYATCGSGYPLILIHGNGGSHKELQGLMLRLANNYTVYALDSRSQGQSTATEKLSYRLMAKDVKQFIEKVGLDKPYVIGHSDGGIVALQIAIDYPDVMGAFVACGANSNPAAFKAYFSIAIKTAYRSKHKELDRIMVEEPNFTAEQLRAITVPAYVLAGEFDIVKLKDTKFIADCIPNSKVAILRGQGHSSYMKQNSERCAYLADEFFKSL